MFRCKFCHEDKPDTEEASAHKGLCKQCHSNNTRYKRIKAGGTIDPEFVKKYELLCRHNESIGGYVPKVYYQSYNRKLDRCPCCGMPNVKAYPSNPSMCYACGSMENTYRSLLRQLEKADSEYTVHASRVGKIIEIEKTYRIRNIAGLRVPLKYLSNATKQPHERFEFKGVDSTPKYIRIISENGKVHKLRVGSVCKDCGTELNELNWSLGNTRCKPCHNAHVASRRRKGHVL